MCVSVCVCVLGDFCKSGTSQMGLGLKKSIFSQDCVFGFKVNLQVDSGKDCIHLWLL